MSGHHRVTHRRELLAGTAALLLTAYAGASHAMTIRNALPWQPESAEPPQPPAPGGWKFFTPDEAQTIEALVDRIIPPDAQTPGGKDAGVAVYIDRQLAGPYGSSQALYMRPPFIEGTPQQGSQSPLTPALRYRKSLAALTQHCKQSYAGKSFHELPDAQKDTVLRGLDSGHIQLQGLSAKGFMEQLVKNSQEGFFADPIYGGNRDMVGWKMIGFPGARYDYRDWVEHHNERYPLPPVGLQGRPDWVTKS